MQHAWNCEETPVTFQIGMVASDGIVIASDKKATKLPVIGTRSSSLVDKISVLENICYCCSGDTSTVEAARNVADNFANIGSALNIRTWLISQIQLALMIEAKKAGKDIQARGEILFAFREAFELWQVCINPPQAIYVERYEDKATQGDHSNAALFFLEKYYPQTPHTATTLELLPMAAHCVLMAGEVNQTFVGGLEIAICTKTKIKKLSDKELEPLIQLSFQLDLETRQILIPKQRPA